MRLRKTAAAHELEGTRPEYTERAPSTVVAGRPRYPSHLTGKARAEFKRLVGYLEKRGTVTEGDLAVLAVAAEVSARWQEAKALLAAEGLQITRTVLDSDGRPHEKQILNPLLSVCERCESKLLALTRSLGLTPDTRERVVPAKRRTISKADILQNPELFFKPE